MQNLQSKSLKITKSLFNYQICSERTNIEDFYFITLMWQTKLVVNYFESIYMMKFFKNITKIENEFSGN